MQAVLLPDLVPAGAGDGTTAQVPIQSAAMLQRLRVLVSLALFVAVPVQGIAAVAGGLCMASAGQGTGAASHAHGGDAGESGHQHEPEAGSTASHALCGPGVACGASAA